MSCELDPPESFECLFGHCHRVVVEDHTSSKFASCPQVSVTLLDVLKFILRVELRAASARAVLQDRRALHSNGGVALESFGNPVGAFGLLEEEGKSNAVLHCLVHSLAR